MKNGILDLSEDDIEKLLPSSVRSLIVDKGLLELPVRSYQENPRKRYFRIRQVQGPDLHLSIGCELEETYKRTKRFNEVLPEFSCKPIFYIKQNPFDLFGQEYFEGTPIDECLVMGYKTKEEITEIISEIFSVLDSLENPSSEQAMKDEIASFKKEITTNATLSEIDLQFLNQFILPCLDHSTSIDHPTTRWSSGDLAARNILVGEDNFKIVDCEFAYETHFHQEDWVRIAVFSTPPFNDLGIIRNKLESVSLATQMYFRLRQVQLNKEVNSPSRYRMHASEDLIESLFLCEKTEPSSGFNSLILNGIIATRGRLKDESKIRLQKEIHLAEKENAVNAKREKIRNMQKSFSWRITSPFRFLRRKFVDPLRKEETSDEKAYYKWIKDFDTLNGRKMKKLRRDATNLKKRPLISLIMPVFNPPEVFLREAIESVFDQVYGNWELCITDDASTKQYVKPVLQEYAKKDSRIKLILNESNQHISSASNSAINNANGEFCAFLDHDDKLRPHSLLEIAKAINQVNDVVLIYSDEDKIDDAGKRSFPFLKPDWNPDLLCSQNYICHLVAVRRESLQQLGGFRKGFEGSQDWDLLLRLTENLKPSNIIHVPRILYHWRESKYSTAQSMLNKNYAFEASNNALKEHYNRTNSLRVPILLPNGYFYGKSTSRQHPSVTIIIPTRNGGEVLKRCVISILENTIYNSFDILIADNDSDQKNTKDLLLSLESKYSNVNICKFSGDFNYSLINNSMISKVSSRVIVLLNDDTEITVPDWLIELTSNAIRKDIGAVGAKLLYPNGTIQHAGVILGLGGIADHAFKTLPENYAGQMGRANLPHNVSAVTAACLAIEKDKFLKAGGFNEENLKVAFNDVDLCIKLTELGYRNLYLPQVRLIHHESYSRGYEDTPEKKLRFNDEILYLKETWGHKLSCDPCYNPNLSLKNTHFRLKKKKTIISALFS